MNLYSHRKVTPYFAPFQTFWLLFLQLIATIVPIGDKSGKPHQNLSCHQGKADTKREISLVKQNELSDNP